MVVHPLESVGARRRSLRGALPSVVVHAAIVLAAVHATAHAALPPASPQVVDTLYFAPPRVPEQPRTASPANPRSPSRRSGDVAPTTDVHQFVAPTTVPGQLPAITPGTIAPTIDPREFGEGIAHDLGGARGAVVGDVLTGAQVDRQVEPLPGAPAPEYPNPLRSAGVRGAVLAEFVVDTTGRMEPGSFRPLRSDDPLFTAATRAALLHTRFRPAESNGRRVRQLVQQTFSFVLR